MGMSQQPEELVGYKALIAAAFAECETKANKLHARYLIERHQEGLDAALHGEGPDAFADWMAGRSEPRITSFILVSRVLNRRLEELGKPAMLPNLPFPKSATPGGGDGLPLTDQVYVRCCTQTGSDLPFYEPMEERQERKRAA